MMHQQKKVEKIDMNGYTLHLIPTKKFKTVHFVAKFKTALQRENITTRALIPYILMQGSKNYPTRPALEKKLDDLYGAVLTSDSSKKGNNHIISIRFNVANEKFTKNNSIFEEAITLFNEMLFYPRTEEKQFSNEIVKRELVTLKQKIESIIDDKLSYANMRLIEEMCSQETYQLPVHGYVEDLEKITAKSAYEYYQKIIKEDDLDIYVVGDIDSEEIEELFATKIQRKSVKRSLNKIEKNVQQEKEEVNEVIEKQDIQQAKLHIGYRTNCTYKDDLYPALQVFNGLFGAFPSSKLFINVREKNSLAYYAASRIESHKGLLFVFSGIAPKDYKAARDIIEHQLKAMQQGDFTEEELEKTKNLIINQLLETLDNPQGIIEMLYQQTVAGTLLPPSQLIERIKNVDKNDCIQIANQIKEDTVYLLTDKGGHLDG